MIDEWQAAIEQILAPAMISNSRVLGLIGTEPRSGVTALSLMLARSIDQRGADVLYLNLASSAVPQVSSMRSTATLQNWREAQIAGTFSAIEPHVTSNNRGLFDNVPWLRSELVNRFKTYSHVVVDLPAFSQQSVDCLNPITSAAACDAVILLAVRGRTTRRQVARATEILRSARVNLVGSILNEYEYVSPGEEIAAFSRKMLSPTGQFGANVADKLARAEILR